jgi:transposase-like protein
MEGSSMLTTEQPTPEFRITAVCSVIDPAERQRRLAQAYGLIMEFGRQKRILAKAETDARPNLRTEEENRC